MKESMKESTINMDYGIDFRFCGCYFPDFFLVIHLLYYDVAIYHLEFHGRSFMKALDKNKYVFIL